MTEMHDENEHEETEAETETETTEDEPENGAPGRTMKDVSHTPPTGDQDVNRVFERGAEGRVDER